MRTSKSKLEYSYKYRKENRKKYLLSLRISHQRRRLKCLNYYSNNNPKCNCCGEKEIKFLALDHINGGGTQQRQSKGGRNIVAWILKHNFPNGFRVLCHNCNMAKGFWGKCPHQQNVSY